MGRGDRSHSRRPRAPRERGSGRWLRRSTASLVVLVLALAGASYQFDLGTRWFGWEYPSPVTTPAEVLPPPGLSLPSPEAAQAIAEKGPELDADPAKVRRAVAKLAASKLLGPHVAVAVDQLSNGSRVYRHGADLVTPASTMKLLTTVAALEVLGPDHRFRTTVGTGATPRQIVLVGGGDPLLGRAQAPGDVYPHRADLRTLALATAKALMAAGHTSVQVRYDTSLFEGPAVNPTWESSYLVDVVSRISPLWVDEGREGIGLTLRADDPAAAAARLFATTLAKQGIAVRGQPRPGSPPVGSTEVAAVNSAPLSQIVQWVLEVSDNDAAEVLFRHVAIAEGRPASFEGSATAVRAVLQRLGIDMSGQRILDGSGLSRQNRLSPETFVSLLELAASEEHPRLRAVAVDLPVAGFTGSLTDRFDTGDPAGLGRVRAKTGTLSGVSGLAGIVTDRDGTVMAFVAVADRVRLPNTLDAQATLDEIAAALAGCSCASPTT